MKETFFETCVANTAHDLSKGLCVTGWKILTQLLAEANPTLVTAHINRYIELRNSYQNRPVVGLSILWSTGQAGHKSLHSGIKVWLEIMLPVISMKHYTKFVVDYLGALLATHNITTATSLNKPVMDIPNFLTVQDTVFIVSTQINKAYASHLPQSGQLLQYIDSNWSRVKSALDVPDFHETIEAFDDYNQSVINKEGLALAAQGCDSISEKMSTPGQPWFPWKTLSFLLLISTAAIINLDCQKNG